MIEEGQIVLLRFPYVDNTSTVKVRPGVVLRKVPGGRNDWLVCMISSQLDRVRRSLVGWISGESSRPELSDL